MTDPVITVDDVLAWNELSVNTNRSSILQRIPLAQSFVNDELNNAYDSTAHGHIEEYKAAVKSYVFYLYIDKPNFTSLVGIGQLKERTVDQIYLSPAHIRDKKAELLKEVLSYINIIKTAMKAVDTAVLEETGNVMTMGGAMYLIGVGGNKNHKTDYGLGMQQDDDDLRQELPYVVK
jgi:hypothetical protein